MAFTLSGCGKKKENEKFEGDINSFNAQYTDSNNEIIIDDYLKAAYTYLESEDQQIVQTENINTLKVYCELSKSIISLKHTINKYTSSTEKDIDVSAIQDGVKDLRVTGILEF